MFALRKRVEESFFFLSESFLDDLTGALRAKAKGVEFSKKCGVIRVTQKISQKRHADLKQRYLNINKPEIALQITHKEKQQQLSS